MSIRYTHLCAFVLLLLWFQTSIAKESYQGALSFGYGININDREINDYSAQNFAGTYYLAPVNKNNRPWLRADFLDRVGNLTFKTQKNSFTGENLYRNGPYLDSDNSQYDIGFTYRAPTTPWLFGLNYVKLSNKFYSNNYEYYSSYGKNIESSANKGIFTLGYYAQNSFLFKGSLIYMAQSNQTERNASFETDEENLTYKALDLGFSWVKSYGHSWLSLDFSLGYGIIDYSDYARYYADGESGNLLVDVAYYFNEKTSLGNKLALTYDTAIIDRDRREWSIYFNTFITRYLSIGASIGYVDNYSEYDSYDVIEGALYLELLI